MRVTFGKLTRSLPRVEPQPDDVVIANTFDEAGNADGFFVAPAVHLGHWTEPTLHLSRVTRTRKRAVQDAWALLALRGQGRLLDYQRGRLAEQPFLWSVRLVASPEIRTRFKDFAVRTSARENLARALAVWSGMPRKDARQAARDLVCRGGHLTLALTQTECRTALHVTPEMRPNVKAVWALLQVTPIDVLPEVVRRPPAVVPESPALLNPRIEAA